VTRHRLATLVLLAACLAGCDRDPVVDPGPEPAAGAEILSGDLQQDTVASVAAAPLLLRVTDARGRPAAGVTVRFAVTSGGGTVADAVLRTSAAGEAGTRWTLGTVAGDTQRVEARAVDPGTGQALPLATFRAVGLPGEPAAIVALQPAARTGQAGQTLADSLAARVTDVHGNPVSGATVAWTVPAGGGGVSPATSVTDAAGVARGSWILGLQLGTLQAAEASISPAVRASFTAMPGLPLGAALMIVAGDGQAGTVGGTLAPLAVELRTPLGLPLAGAAVTWIPAAGAGTATPPAAVTGADGRATATWTLGTVAGAQQLTAAVEGAGPVVFGATAGAGAGAVLSAAGGGGQAAPPRAPLAASLAVRLVDAYGNAVPDVAVAWSPASGGAAIPTTSRTDGEGVARTQWTLGPGEGTQILTASVEGAGTETFAATAVTGPLAAVEVAPDSALFTLVGQSARITARPVDAYGNTVGGISIAWSTTNAAVATVSPDSPGEPGAFTAVVRPAGNGAARVRAVAGTLEGTVDVEVRVVPASVTVSAPGPTLMQLDSLQLTATVRDAAGSALPDAPVAWSTSNSAVATVAPGGRVRGVGGGSATITASSGSIGGSASLTVHAVLMADSLAVGAQHACVRDGSGTAYCWGSNLARQLGTAGDVAGMIPSPVPGRRFASLAAGATSAATSFVSHTCGVQADGEAYCWGGDETGQLGTGGTASASCHAGAGWDVPCTATPTRVTGTQTWRQLAAGGSHTCGITTGGTAYCWGSNANGQLGNIEPDMACPVENGARSIRCTRTPMLVYGGHSFTRVVAGTDFTCALTPAGKTWCWGANTWGQLGNGTRAGSQLPVPVQGTDVFVDLTAGNEFACGLTTAGSLLCWGRNERAQLGEGGARPIRTAPGPVHPTTGAGPYRSVRAGATHACALNTAGRLFCWGSNEQGELGNGNRTPQTVPTPAATTNTFRGVDAGFQYSCALSTAGVVYCWGLNGPGRLGTGTVEPVFRTTPGAVRAP
jgi:alpha-tubulin suppressor-like RCC1 family protein